MKRVVIKVGSHILCENSTISHKRFEALCEFLAKVFAKYEVILVSSGAIGVARTIVDIKKDSITNRQALAAIGQPYLMAIYENLMKNRGINVAQILLTASDFDSRKKTQYAKNVIDRLCEHKILPIINENDTIGIEEILFGDNDRLSASVAYYFGADILTILSDIDGYYTADPRVDKSATIRPIVQSLTKEELSQKAEAGSDLGSGGIVTKLKAADFLMERNLDMFLASGFDLGVATSFLIDEKQIGGTLFKGKI